MWSKVKTRLISAIVLIVLVLGALFLAPDWGVALIVSGVTYAVIYELTKVFNLKEKHAITIVNFIFATVFMALTTVASLGIFPLLIVLYIMSLLTVAVINNERVKLPDVCSSVFLVLYSVLLLGHITSLRRLDNGIALVILALLGAYVTDSGAYFTGMAIGKHKLIEKVSPNKTIEGAIGGIVAAFLGFMIFGLVMMKMGYEVSFLSLAILSVLCGIVAQLGDLSASIMKRNFKIKDFGNLIPGHGGIADRVDSLMFVAPIVFYFIQFFPVIK